MDASRLFACGWSSFRPELFLGEPGRKAWDVSPNILSILRDCAHGTAVLELCCGAGRLCIDLARRGYKVTGIDLDDRMLVIARDALAKEPPEIQERVAFVREDVTQFALERSFDFVIFEDDGFVYLLTQDDQMSCLHRIRDHMNAEGKLLLAFATPQRELRAGQSQTYEYDPIRQIKTVACRWTVVDGQGDVSEACQGYERRRMTYPCELELLLRTCGFRVLQRWGDLDRTPFEDPMEQEYHYLCQKV